jgi:hypothetical protein
LITGTSSSTRRENEVTQIRRTHRGLALTVLSVVAILGSAGAVGAAVSAFDPQPDPPGKLGSVGMVQGQTLRVNISNVGNPNLRDALACVATVEFFDQEGNVLAQTRLRLIPGEGQSTDLVGDDNLIGNPNIRLQVRAVVEVDTKDCPAVASMELFDTETGKTEVFIGDPGV